MQEEETSGNVCLKKKAANKIHLVPLSNNTVSRKINELANNEKRELK